MMKFVGAALDEKGRPVFQTAALTPDWLVRFYFGNSAGGSLVIERVQVFPCGVVPQGGITMALLRKITISPLQRYVALDASAHAAAARPSPLKPIKGRAPTQQDYRKMLARYTYLVNAKDPHPAKTLAAELKQPRSTVRTWIRRAKAL